MHISPSEEEEEEESNLRRRSSNLPCYHAPHLGKLLDLPDRAKDSRLTHMLPQFLLVSNLRCAEHLSDYLR